MIIKTTYMPATTRLPSRIRATTNGYDLTIALLEAEGMECDMGRFHAQAAKFIANQQYPRLRLDWYLVGITDHDRWYAAEFTQLAFSSAGK